ncbi:unnamed protein product [Blepharisma stoltei]|uniref:Peptidase M41 domain-containing protein n=1 Tax=Blepharisma stoltei TaxID=1481888 RepID=A0AAU9IVW3_9CILI|nr:unnamed protein product [Blepharisma stoltei]
MNFGMSEKLGTVGYHIEQEALSKPFSEDTNRIIDEEVRSIVEWCIKKTRSLLGEKKELVEKLAETLIEKEMIKHKELVEILGERPFEYQQEYQKYLEEAKKNQV